LQPLQPLQSSRYLDYRVRLMKKRMNILK
jgi:hypothetical protein